MSAKQARLALRSARAGLGVLEPDCYGVRQGQHSSWASADRVREAAFEAMREHGLEHELVGTRGEGDRLVSSWVWSWIDGDGARAWKSEPVEIAVDTMAGQPPGTATSAALTTGERNFLKYLLQIRVRADPRAELAHAMDAARPSVREHVERVVNHVAKVQGTTPEALLGEMHHSPQRGTPVEFSALTVGQVAVVWTTLLMSFRSAREFEEACDPGAEVEEMEVRRWDVE